MADNLPFENVLSWQSKFKGSYASLDPEKIAPNAAGSENRSSINKVHFLKPETFMNLSGEPVREAAAFFKIKPEAILVVHDELELPLGTISLKFGGGLGGHNGLRSMKACFGTADFWRIRIGIGRPDSRLPGEGGPPGSGEGIIDWVLSNFNSREEETLKLVFSTAGELVKRVLTEDPQALLKTWAKKKTEPEPSPDTGG